MFLTPCSINAAPMCAGNLGQAIQLLLLDNGASSELSQWLHHAEAAAGSCVVVPRGPLSVPVRLGLKNAAAQSMSPGQ